MERKLKKEFYKPTKPKISRGDESPSPEKDTEKRVLALRGAAATKTLQCTKV